MGECVYCLKETDNKVNDNINGKSYLCKECERLFEQCSICGEWYLGEELAENGLCDNCTDELNQEEL
jgi:hypothetical protein